MRVSAEAMEIDPRAVDLDIFHALICAPRRWGAAMVESQLVQLSAWVNSGFRGCVRATVKTHKMTR